MSDNTISYSNQNSMVLAQEHTHGSMEQNRVQINPHIYGQSLTKEARMWNEGKTIYSANGPGTVGQL